MIILKLIVCLCKISFMAEKLTNKEKQGWAKILYLKTDMNQKEISKKVEVTESTMSKWIIAGKWEVLRSSYVITREQELRRIYIQINELNTVIEEREDKRYATPSEADTITKLAAAARSLESDTSIAEVISVSTQIIDFVRKSDLKQAQELSNIFDAFIKFKLNKF